MPTYRCLEIFPYGKTKTFVGKLIDTTDAIGDLFLKMGRVEPLYPVEAYTTTPQPETAPDPKSQSDRGRYQRRDMIAEKAAAAPKRRGRPRGSKNKSSLS